MQPNSALFIIILTLSVGLISCTKREETHKSSDSNQVVPEINEKELPALSQAAQKQLIDGNNSVSFNEHIQPILSANCYHCHGPDSGTRMPEDEPYRLDNEEGAFQVRKNGKPNIIKGDPDHSYLIKLMETKDPDLVMPLHPSRSPHGKIMDPAEIALVRRWVKEGAVFEDHWSYITPKKAELPTVQQASWPRNAIDHFILNKLEQQSIKPSKEQEKSRLLRRLTFDLTGLAPSIDELKNFTTDTRDFETVYHETVNKLLQSDAYAEHFTRHWLDVARYADTHGIHIDNSRSIWPYRDWVIRAFKANMPFDQFTQEQIAGDLIPNATLDQKVATGFHRCLPTTGEGGAIAEEYHAVYAQDRVNATTTAWLGITAGCAACHDHKFDAITTKENYELTAFFRNTSMSALDGNNPFHPPNIIIPADQDKERYKSIIPEIHAQNNRKDQHRKTNEPVFKQWLTSQKNAPPIVSQPIAGHLVHLPLNDQNKGFNHPTFFSQSPLTWAPGNSGDSVKFVGNNTVNLGNTGDFERNQAFSYGAWIKVPEGSSSGIISKMDNANAHRGYDLWAQNGNLAVHLIHRHPQDFIKVTTNTKFPPNKWMHVMVTYNGKNNPKGIKIYVNGKDEKLTVNANKLTKTIKTKAPFLLGSRSGGQPFHNGQLQNFKLFNRALTPYEVLRIATEGTISALVKNDTHSQQQINQIRDYYFSHKNHEHGQILHKIYQLNTEKTAIEKRGVRTLVMDERPDQKPTAHILIRGQYSVKDKEVLSPNTPAFLPAMTEDMPKNRLGLAQWLTAKENPLPARVTVNRYWYYLFGSGIVESNGDFGVMGARPTHPKLLDWLAVDFVESGWDLHHLIRTMVLSSTYRQSSNITAEQIKIDPLNKYYGRAPRYRLDAEQIRDLALQVSGLLHPKIGGPPVKPYQPINIWEAVAMPQSNTKSYQQDSGNKLYRRSLYTFLKRTAPHPTMELLNAPPREEACVKRELTNTPLQAFVIMNDPQFVEASRQLAAVAMKMASTENDRINHIALKLLSREMTEPEIEIVRDTLDKTMAKFKAQPEEAKKLISVGESIALTELDPCELASWTLIASQILNMDETLNK